MIDYFSLDVEEAEMSILQTIPWDKVTIRVFTIEFTTPATRTSVLDYMINRDYKLAKELQHDLVFVHRNAIV